MSVKLTAKTIIDLLAATGAFRRDGVELKMKFDRIEVHGGYDYSTIKFLWRGKEMGSMRTRSRVDLTRGDILTITDIEGEQGVTIE